ncbi:MAG: UPF0175 family protein [Candidatus Riflebacteria bacterium]|nr:UPF0175 family protein [Candidatus Riflebacteria bacterium]
MRKMQVEYSEAIPALINISPEAFEEEAKMAMAVKLFELGRLTSAQAAELAGIDRTKFLLTCIRFGTASVDWDKNEIIREFQGTLQCRQK